MGKDKKSKTFSTTMPLNMYEKMMAKAERVMGKGVSQSAYVRFLVQQDLANEPIKE